MDKKGVVESLTLMSSLWNNYKPPTAEEEINLTVSTWLAMLSKVATQTVHQAIMGLAAEGRQFAPQVGEIYKAIKDKATETKLLASGLHNSATELRDSRREIISLYAKRGKLTPSEAIAARMTSAEWEEQALTKGEFHGLYKQ